jgi:hypothetical protein
MLHMPAAGARPCGWAVRALFMAAGAEQSTSAPSTLGQKFGLIHQATTPSSRAPSAPVLRGTLRVPFRTHARAAMAAADGGAGGAAGDGAPSLAGLLARAKDRSAAVESKLGAFATAVAVAGEAQAATTDLVALVAEATRKAEAEARARCDAEAQAQRDRAAAQARIAELEASLNAEKAASQQARAQFKRDAEDAERELRELKRVHAAVRACLNGVRCDALQSEQQRDAPGAAGHEAAPGASPDDASLPSLAGAGGSLATPSRPLAERAQVNAPAASGAQAVLPALAQMPPPPPPQQQQQQPLDVAPQRVSAVAAVQYGSANYFAPVPQPTSSSPLPDLRKRSRSPDGEGAAGGAEGTPVQKHPKTQQRAENAAGIAAAAPAPVAGQCRMEGSGAPAMRMPGLKPRPTQTASSGGGSGGAALSAGHRGHIASAPDPRAKERASAQRTLMHAQAGSLFKNTSSAPQARPCASSCMRLSGGLAALNVLTRASRRGLPQDCSSPYKLGNRMFSAGELAELSRLAADSGKAPFNTSEQFRQACHKLFHVKLKLPATNELRSIRNALEWAARLPGLCVVVPERGARVTPLM